MGGRVAALMAIPVGLLCLLGCAPDVRGEAATEATVAQEAVGQTEAVPPDKPRDEAQVKARQEAQKGAAQAEPISFPDIHFDRKRFDLKPQAREVLNKIAMEMLDRPKLLLVIEGHCDKRGKSQYNLKLGKRRAEAARNYLIDMGVEPHRISVVTYGEGRPLDIRRNEEAWAKNRRAHFVTKLK